MGLQKEPQPTAIYSQDAPLPTLIVFPRSVDPSIKPKKKSLHSGQLSSLSHLDRRILCCGLSGRVSLCKVKMVARINAQGRIAKRASGSKQAAESVPYAIRSNEVRSRNEVIADGNPGDASNSVSNSSGSDAHRVIGTAVGFYFQQTSLHGSVSAASPGVSVHHQ